MNTPQSIWKDAEGAIVAGDVATLERLLREHEQMFREERPQSSWYGGLAPTYTGGDARTIITREHHFTSFDELVRQLDAINRGDTAIARFEMAVDAVVAGDVRTLERFLRQDPALIRTRSTRTHHSTLLHYVGANGVESWRQKTPPNAVQVAEVLLREGAEIDAMADMYGGSTTLGLVATSIHPLLAGVQNALMEFLLNHGAAVDHPGAAGNGQGIVNGCLANGRPQAAEFLARRGARLDLEGAAGVGRLDVVQSFFAGGTLKANATPAQMKSGFQWACEYGHTQVVDFLLDRGIDVGEMHRGQTGLHWAAYGGYRDIVKLLLERGAPVNLKDESWQNTPLGWALHGWANPVPEAGSRFHHDVVALLIAAGSTVDPECLSNEKVMADPLMLAALRGESSASRTTKP